MIERRSLPPEITTGCAELDLVWKTYAPAILERPGILITDTDDDLTWHAFLGHSIDMRGFRAAEFAGVDDLTRHAPKFVPLRERGVGVPELANLWDIPAIREYLLSGTKGLPVRATLEVLRSEGGATGKSLAEAFEFFPYIKFHWSVRALLQNSAVLASDHYSFRRWLQRESAELGVTEFPPPDFRVTAGDGLSLEDALVGRLQSFYMVGPELAPYMICGWLWKQGLTAVFANFKWDSFHGEFISRYGRGVIPTRKKGFRDWWSECTRTCRLGSRTSASG